MENKKNKVNEEEKLPLYTMSMLFGDIQAEPNDSTKGSSEDDRVHREYVHKLKVIQMVFELKLTDFDLKNDNSENDNSEDIKREIEVQVEGNELLFGYTFFLSLNSRFDYSWNYLRKQTVRYMDFLYDVYKFTSSVVYDINLINSKISRYKDLHIEFNELFDVHFIDDAPYVKATINWKNFHQISKVKNGYYVIAKYDKTILLTSLRKYNDKPDSFIGAVNQMLATYNNKTDEKDKF